MRQVLLVLRLTVWNSIPLFNVVVDADSPYQLHLSTSPETFRSHSLNEVDIRKKTKETKPNTMIIHSQFIQAIYKDAKPSYLSRLSTSIPQKVVVYSGTLPSSHNEQVTLSEPPINSSQMPIKAPSDTQTQMPSRNLSERAAPATSVYKN